MVADTETYAETTIGHIEELQETDEHKVLAINGIVKLMNCLLNLTVCEMALLS